MKSVDGGGGCAVTVTTSTTIVGEDSSTQTIGPETPLILQEWRIQVQWASTDLSLFESTPVSTTSSSVSSKGTRKPSGDASASNAQHDSHLSTAAKAGIGVGVGIACVLLLVAVIFFLRARKRQHRKFASEGSNAPSVQQLHSNPVYEVDAQDRKPELEAKAARTELEGT